MLREYQRKVVNDYNRVVFVAWDRAVGKSYTAARMALDYVKEHEYSVVVIASSTLAMVDIVRRTISKFVNQECKEFKSSSGKFHILFKNKSTILFTSMNSDLIRGWSADLVIIDGVHLLQLLRSDISKFEAATLGKKSRLVIFTDYEGVSVHTENSV